MGNYPNDRERPTIVLDKRYDARTKWVTREYGEFVGKTVKEIRPLRKSESEAFGWDYEYEDGFAIVFTDGSVLIPSQDPEGNGAGWLFVADAVVAK